jgi:hypothetical protein
MWRGNEFTLHQNVSDLSVEKCRNVNVLFTHTRARTDAQNCADIIDLGAVYLMLN